MMNNIEKAYEEFLDSFVIYISSSRQDVFACSDEMFISTVFSLIVNPYLVANKEPFINIEDRTLVENTKYKMFIVSDSKSNFYAISIEKDILKWIKGNSKYAPNSVQKGGYVDLAYDILNNCVLILDKSKQKFDKRYYFDNGYGASVVRHSGSDGWEEGLYELAVLKYYEDDCRWHLCFDTPITDDTIGNLTLDEVDFLLDKIKKLESAGGFEI